MTTELIPVADGSHIWAERSGDGPLHGSVHDSRLWNGVFAELTRHHTVVRYDARGLGRLSTPTAPFRYEDDLLAVLDRFGFQAAGLVGLSMGSEVPTRTRATRWVAFTARRRSWADLA
jgi:3-oxoadipate enol-lactonase